ncbi:MAG: hypothetical protein ACJAXF_003371 [Polaribacter sp.]|jgi:hypothetical protein
MLKSCFLFFKNNGMFGYGLKILPKVLSLRGGDENTRNLRLALEAQLLDLELQAILDDPGFSREQKRKLAREITKGVLEKSLKTSQSWKTGSYRKALQFDAEHPIYAQVKRKFPFIIMSKYMFEELKRGALANAIGVTTIPIKLTTYTGLSMPVFVVSSIIEKVVPYESVKIGCRFTKRFVGLPFVICCVVIDKVTESFEEKFFGQTIPIDINNLMGTVPTRSDIATLDDITGLKEQAQYPHNLESISDTTRKKWEDILKQDDMMSSLSSTTADFEQAMGSAATGDNVCYPPTYNPGTTLGP